MNSTLEGPGTKRPYRNLVREEILREMEFPQEPEEAGVVVLERHPEQRLGDKRAWFIRRMEFHIEEARTRVERPCVEDCVPVLFVLKI